MSARGLVLAVVAVLAASPACSDDSGGDGGRASAPASTPASTTTPPATDDPAYAERGPYEVGVTTLALEDGTPVEVYYPADAADVTGAEPATYRTDDPLPDELRALVPSGVDLTVPIDAYRDVPVSGDGPFPLLLYAHGAGSYRNYSSALQAGIASHGIVLASTDYLDRGLLALATGGMQGAAGDGDVPERQRARLLARARARDRAVAEATLDLLLDAAATPGHRLEGAVDPNRVAAAGHSAGGGTAAAVSDDPRVDAVVGWASTAEDVAPGVATLSIVAAGDLAVTPARSEEVYDALGEPKALVVIDDTGHNTFTDFCVNLREGRDLIQLALDLGFPIPDRLVELGRNGCAPSDLAPEEAWPIIQHFTVAWVLWHTGVNDAPIGLGDGVATAFPVTVDYRHDP